MFTIIALESIYFYRCSSDGFSWFVFITAFKWVLARNWFWC